MTDIFVTTNEWGQFYHHAPQQSMRPSEKMATVIKKDELLKKRKDIKKIRLMVSNPEEAKHYFNTCFDD